MTLKEALNLIKYSANEIDIKVCYNNEYDEECTLCKTFVDETAYKEDKKYWSDRITKFAYTMDVRDMERYSEFEVSMLNAQGKNHFFIFASNFH